MKNIFIVLSLVVGMFAIARPPFNNETEDRFATLEAAQLTNLVNGESFSNATDDKVEVLSDDNDTTFQVTGYEAKDAILNLWADQGDDAADKYSFTSDKTSNNLTIKNSTTAIATFTSGGNLSLIGSVTGDGGDAMSGFLQKMVAATATTITAAQCGSTFYNSGAVQIELPEASAVIGCRLTFVTMNAANFDINPDDADQILVLTNAAGDKIRNATLGNSVVLQAMSASEWVVVGKEQGTWSDAN